MSRMTIIVNGEEISLEENSTIAHLLAFLNLKREDTAIELNGDFLEPGKGEKTILKDGDRLEIVRFVGGG